MLLSHIQQIVLKSIGDSKSNLSSPVGDFNDTVLQIIDTAVNLAS